MCNDVRNSILFFNNTYNTYNKYFVIRNQNMLEFLILSGKQYMKLNEIISNVISNVKRESFKTRLDEIIRTVASYPHLVHIPRLSLFFLCFLLCLRFLEQIFATLSRCMCDLVNQFCWGSRILWMRNCGVRLSIRGLFGTLVRLWL